MTNTKWIFNRLVMCLSEVVVGILLIINPLAFTTAIVRIIGVVLLVAGLFSAIGYFRTPPQEAQRSAGFIIALSCFISGLFFLLQAEMLFVAFKALTIAYGLVILFTGIVRIQWTVDMLRLKNERWYLAGIGALLSLLFAGIILFNPFETVEFLWKFVAVSMIINAVIDLVAMIFIRIPGDYGKAAQAQENGRDRKEVVEQAEIVEMNEEE